MRRGAPARDEFWQNWLRNEPEVHGLVALDGDPGIAIEGAGRSVRRAYPAVRPGPRALGSVAHPSGSGGTGRGRRNWGAHGPYALQAAIAACHGRALTPSDTDWPRIAALYATLAQVAPSPVVDLNRAVAVGMAFGPEAGLSWSTRCLGAVAEELSSPADVRGDLLAKLDRLKEARAEFERAAALTRNARERDLLLERARSCSRKSRE